MKPEYASRYDALYRHHWWWRARERYILDWVERLARAAPVRTILDVGCGDGLLFDRLRRFGEVWGVEPDAGLLSAGSRWAGRIENVPFGPAYRTDRRYDLALMLDVLEHIDEDRAALECARDVLHPGGTLLLTVPALPLLWSYHDVANCHHRRYTLAGLDGLVKRAGFECLHLSYFFGWTVLPLLLRRLLHPGGASPTPAESDYAVAVPREPVNRLLLGLCRVEQRLSARAGTPVGSSLIAVLRRPGRAAATRGGA